MPPSPAAPPAPLPVRWSGSILAFMLAVHALALMGLLRPIRLVWVPAALGVYLAVGFGTTLGLHRLLSHRAFTCPKWVEYALVSAAMVTAQGSPLLWVANHRIHHGHSDAPGDIHSPRRGFAYAHMGWFLNALSTDAEAWRTFCRDFADDAYYHWLLRYRLVPQLLAVVGVAAAFGWQAVPFVLYLPVVLWMHSTYAVNSVCHTPGFGSRSFATPDDSRNVWWVGLLALGEGWHNNHHAFPRAALHGFTRRQVDPSGLLLRAMCRVGLASQLHHPPAAALERQRLEEAPPRAG